MEARATQFDAADFLLTSGLVELEREESASTSCSTSATYDFCLEREDALVAHSAKQDWTLSLNDMRLRVRKTVDDTVSELSSVLSVSYSSAAPQHASISGADPPSRWMGERRRGEEDEEVEGDVMVGGGSFDHVGLVIFGGMFSEQDESGVFVQFVQEFDSGPAIPNWCGCPRRSEVRVTVGIAATVHFGGCRWFV